MKVKKAIALGLVLGSLVSYGAVSANAFTQNLKVTYGTVKQIIIDGVDKTPTEVQPFVYNGTTYVPLRYVGEAIGKDVSWDGKTGTVYIGGEVEKPLKEVYLYRKPFMDSSGALINAKDNKENKDLVFYNMYGNTLSRIEYPLNGLATKLFVDIGHLGDVNNARGESIYRIYDQNDNLLYESFKMKTDYEWQKVEIPIDNVLSIKLEVECKDHSTSDIPTLRNLRVLTTDY